MFECCILSLASFEFATSYHKIYKKSMEHAQKPLCFFNQRTIYPQQQLLLPTWEYSESFLTKVSYLVRIQKKADYKGSFMHHKIGSRCNSGTLRVVTMQMVVILHTGNYTDLSNLIWKPTLLFPPQISSRSAATLSATWWVKHNAITLTWPDRDISLCSVTVLLSFLCRIAVTKILRCGTGYCVISNPTVQRLCF